MWGWNIFRWNHKKSISSEVNKPPDSDGLTAQFCKHFSNELTIVLLDVYDSWGKLNTMGITYRTGIISAIYKRLSKRYWEL